MTTSPSALRLIALAVWANGIGMAIYDGTLPGHWFPYILAVNPQHALTYVYPTEAVVRVALMISLETMGLYAILRWLPVRAGLRFAISTVVVFSAYYFFWRNSWSDGPGYAYTNLTYLARVLVGFLVVDLILLSRAVATRLSAHQFRHVA